MLNALVKTLGIVAYAAKEAGIQRSVHYRWLKIDEGYKTSVELINDMAIDFAEARLFKQVQVNEWKAIMYMLRTKGRYRGYALHKENKGIEDFIINFIVQNPEVAEMIKNTRKEL
jgi:hypothetical protein